MKFTYTKIGDYYLLDLALPKQKSVFFGRYGRLRLTYLKRHKRVLYTNLLTSCKLNEHLADIDKQANTTLDLLVKQMAESQGITEQLKVINQLEWVGLMNNIKVSAKEIVLKEIIYT